MMVKKLLIKDQIEQVFQPVIGLPLWDLGRLATLEWFMFGNERREVTMRNGKTTIVSEYELHTESTWRMRRNDKILFARRDMYYVAGDDPQKDLIEFDWDVQGANRLDERTTRFKKELETRQLITLSVQADNVGGFSLAFSNGYFLDLFIENSIEDMEYWRLFQPDRKRKHIVFPSDHFDYD